MAGQRMNTQLQKPIFIASIFAALTSVGCTGSFDASFVNSPLTDDLIKEAREGMGEHPGVATVVEDRFGSPQDLRLWLKMPVDVGGTSGSIAETPGKGRVSSLKLSLDSDLEKFDDAAVPLQILSGNGAATELTLVSYDPDTSTCRLAGPLEAEVVEGDRIMVDGGAILKRGRGLYMRHCSHCHGTSGDGNGPTAVTMVPRPRDYRNGIFKFTSTKSLMRPSREDIHRTLRKGIPGTYMPPFVPMLDEQELYEVTEYVRFLSMRGEYERKLAKEFTDFTQDEFASRLEEEKRSDVMQELKEFYADDWDDLLAMNGDDLANAWANAEETGSHVIPKVHRTPDSAESRRRGRELFVSAKLNCANCHGVSAQGNGPQSFEYELVDNKPRPLPGLHDEWGHVVKPRNLTTGIYRGGRRPIDIFRRLYSGINGAKMPAFGGKVPDDQLWDVVNYVLSIPYEVEPGKGTFSEESSTASL